VLWIGGFMAIPHRWIEEWAKSEVGRTEDDVVALLLMLTVFMSAITAACLWGYLSKLEEPEPISEAGLHGRFFLIVGFWVAALCGLLALHADQWSSTDSIYYKFPLSLLGATVSAIWHIRIMSWRYEG
jgi:hypothetical protein